MVTDNSVALSGDDAMTFSGSSIKPTVQTWGLRGMGTIWGFTKQFKLTTETLVSSYEIPPSAILHGGDNRVPLSVIMKG